MRNSITLDQKPELILAIEQALKAKRGLAVGKLGYSEQLVLLFFDAIQQEKTNLQSKAIRPLYLALKYHCERQTGIFPTDIGFLAQYAEFYKQQVCSADFLGLFGSPNELRILEYLPISTKFLKYGDTEPNRSIPYDSTQCYLPLFSGKKILLIAPFASFAKERASKEIYEAVWKKINGKWFEPLCIATIDIPYSFADQDSTFKAFTNSLALYDDIVNKIDEIDYDVALIAAGSLAIPLTVRIKNTQKIGISLGGHLQVLFGILGERWLRDKTWSEHYINEAWVRLPKSLIPKNAQTLADNKSYW